MNVGDKVYAKKSGGVRISLTKEEYEDFSYNKDWSYKIADYKKDEYIIVANVGHDESFMCFGRHVYPWVEYTFSLEEFEDFFYTNFDKEMRKRKLNEIEGRK